MSYPAGAPLPSSKITLIIFDDGILRGIIPIYLENKSLSKSLVRVISLTLYKFSILVLENLSTFKGEILSEKGTYTAHVAKISNLLIITIVSTGKSDLKYFEADYITVQNFKVNDSRSSITGNNGSAGQLIIENNRIRVVGTDPTKSLTHSFMGQIITQII